MKNKLTEFFKNLYKIIMKPEMLILPANLAFFLVLSVIPIIVLIGLIASTFSISLDSVIEFLSMNLPKQVHSLDLFFDSFISKLRKLKNS